MKEIEQRLEVLRDLSIDLGNEINISIRKFLKEKCSDYSGKEDFFILCFSLSSAFIMFLKSIDFEDEEVEKMKHDLKTFIDKLDPKCLIKNTNH